jgi:GGDEF domain-containing protein
VRIYIYARAAGKWKDMVKIADSALYQVKNNG